MKVTSDYITVHMLNIEIDEYQAKVLALLLGKIGGAHPFRDVTSPLYNQLIMAVGQNEYDKFACKHRDDIQQGMFLKSEPINF